VIDSHEETSRAFDIFGSELDDFINDKKNVAFFAPKNEVLEDMNAEDLSEKELESVFKRHVTSGLAAQIPIEFIDWFGTSDGEKITVSVEDDTIVLNDSVSVEEAIPTENRIVYIIDDSLS
jgi:uncharacterized surface protein with fasciclin (FAS1) repeats